MILVFHTTLTFAAVIVEAPACGVTEAPGENPEPATAFTLTPVPCSPPPGVIAVTVGPVEGAGSNVRLLETPAAVFTRTFTGPDGGGNRGSMALR